MTGAGLTMRLIKRYTELHGPEGCCIVLEGPGFNPIRWRPYANAVSCRAAARKMAAKTPQTWGTLAQQLGGATIIDEIDA